jgi:hypothetical protein
MSPIMRIALPIVVTVMSVCMPAVAQQPAGGEGGAQERVAALKQALAANQAALKQYTWTETTEISLKGDVKKRQQW